MPVQHWGKMLKEEMVKSAVVIRLDSADPVDVVHSCLAMLDEAFDHTVNGKGYKARILIHSVQQSGVSRYSDLAEAGTAI